MRVLLVPCLCITPFWICAKGEQLGQFEQSKQFEDSAYEDEGQPQSWVDRKTSVVQEPCEKIFQQQEDPQCFSQL